MKWLAIALAVLAAFVVALIVGPMILGDKGYVLISLGSTAIEMTVISFCILVIGAVIAWYVLSRFVLWALSLITGSHKWFGTLGERKRKRAFYDGLHAMAAGDFDSAQKALGKTTNGDFEGVNYLASAQIAFANDDLAKARYFLVQATDFPKAKVAATVMHARIDVAEEKFEAALEKLNELDEQDRDNKQVVQLKAQILAKLGKWQVLQENLSAGVKPCLKLTTPRGASVLPKVSLQKLPVSKVPLSLNHTGTPCLANYVTTTLIAPLTFNNFLTKVCMPTLKIC